jgi:hypothetical protein
MKGASAARWTGVICALSALALLASPAAAIEFWEDRVAIHGFYGQQIRSLVRDFSFDDDFDLAQWYHVLNLEIEADIAPEGFGPFDLVSAFGRIEVRYDCVWRRACGIFSGADAYGDRARKLPKRLHSGRRAGYVLAEFTGDTRRYRAYTDFSQVTANLRDIPTPSRDPIEFGYIPGLVGLSASKGPDGMLGTEDDPWPYYTEYMDPDHCLFAVQRTKGSADGVGTRNLPVTPGCKIRPIAPMADKANPLRAGDFNPATLAFGGGVLPMRPAPRLAAGPLWSRGERAQGVWLPNERLAQYLRDGEFDSFDQNFRQEELEWNRGASQQDEKELKELYVDLEFLDSRLWLRIGKQNIVWGKTELFRTTDQFNPQDIALASLPSLEESRIALWAVRAVWSFYNVGPLEDVRFEVAMNYDQFEPTDLGRCGEPYAPLPVCDKTYGLMAHGFVADAIAGEIRPPNPWNSWKGTEVGARLEWRYDRFSFAVTDFYGYNDGPYVDPIFSYSRNVDPRTGRPRWGMSTGQCKTGGERSCLTARNALTQHSVNQTQFHFICATSIGFIDLDTTSCGQTIFNSQNATPGTIGVEPRVMIATANIMSGQNNTPDPVLYPASVFFNGAFVLEGLGEFNQNTINALNDLAAEPNTAIQRFLSTTFGANTPTVLVPLVVDPNDEGLADLTGTAFVGDPRVTTWAPTGLQPFLTDEQEALLGCGRFYGTQCDIDGIDLMNAEASASMQSWSVFDGTFGPGLWDTRDASRAQPGTVGFQGGPVCVRYENGRSYILPGCRGPGDPGYDRNVDGSTGDARQPFTNQRFRSEMAVLSWNVQTLLVALSLPLDPDNPRESEFDANRPFRTDGCSFAAPSFCGNIVAYNSIVGARRDSVRAGGNGRYGRRDFIWHGGGDFALRYEKRNVLGFSMDFAEDLTKSNWGLELTWIEGVPFSNNNSFGAVSKASTFNLTLSVDRPTFINFLNQNRTFFFNSQWFFQYVDNYVKGFTSNGPWNTLATFTVTTGYFQDRLLPGVTFVYDFQSNSGAALPSVTYRFTENFSATFGMAGFWGRYEKKPSPLWSAGLDNHVGRGAYKSFVENGLSAVRERDEIFMRIRYTF